MAWNSSQPAIETALGMIKVFDINQGPDYKRVEINYSSPHYLHGTSIIVTPETAVVLAKQLIQAAKYLGYEEVEDATV